MSFSKLFDWLIFCQLVCVACFLLSSLFVASNPYAGFLSVFIGLVAAAHSGGCWYFIRQRVSRTMYGAVLGSSCVMVCIYLETAIFFGQYSACEDYETTDDDSKSSSYGTYMMMCIAISTVVILV